MSAPDPLAPRFDRLLELVDVGSRTIRNVAEDLRPALLDDLGLVPALRALVADFQEWSGVPVAFTIQDGHPPRVGPAAELAMFRAVQEGLANVARHAQAATVRVGLARHDGRISLTIDDDGIGMPPTELNRPGGRPGRSGLFGMQERIETLRPGEHIAIAGYDLALREVRRVPGPNFIADEAVIEVRRNGTVIDEMHPQRRLFTVQRQSTALTAIRSSLVADLYLALGEGDDQTGWTVRAYHKPIVSWIWLGAVIMALGGVVSLTDRRWRVGVAARKPAALPAAAE